MPGHTLWEASPFFEPIWFLNSEDVGKYSLGRDSGYHGAECINATITRDKGEVKVQEVIEEISDLEESRRHAIAARIVNGRSHAFAVATAGKGHQAQLHLRSAGLLKLAELGNNGMSTWSETSCCFRLCWGPRTAAITYPAVT